MQRKLPALLLIAAAIIQVTYRSELQSVLSKPLLLLKDYKIFTDEFRSFTILAGLIVLFAAMFLLSAPGTKQNTAGNRFWYWGFFGILFTSMLIVTGANPQGRFPWNKHEAYIEIETRSRKPTLYKNLSTTPDLIALGSSVSFLMPMDYFEEKWGLQAFNFSVNGGGPADFVNTLNTIRKISPDSKMPSIIMAEISNIGLSNVGTTLTPLEYIPDMETPSQQIGAVEQIVQNTLRINLLSDALFTLAIIDRGRWDIIMTAKNDGTLIQKQEKTSNTQYRRLVENNIPVLEMMQFCEHLDENGKRSIENLVELSREYKFSLVIYRPPVNEDFYNFSRYGKSRYAPCLKLFDEFMNDVATKNPNVFFRDLSQDREITTGGKEVYRDTHHLTAQGHRLLLKALNDEIESALRWSRANR